MNVMSLMSQLTVKRIVDDDDFPLSVVKLARELFDCEVKELIDIDSNIKTCDIDMSKWVTSLSKKTLYKVENF